MRITICHHHELGPQTLAALRELASVFRLTLKEDDRIMKSLADLQADVARETSVTQAAVTLLGGLSQQIANLKSNNTDPTTAAAIDALASQVENSTDALSAAVTANTPAADAGTTDNSAPQPAPDNGTAPAA